MHKISSLLSSFLIILTFAFPIIRQDSIIVDMSKALGIELSKDVIIPSRVWIILPGKIIHLDFASEKEAKDFFESYYYWKLKESGVIKL